MNAWQRFWVLPVGTLALIALAVWTSDPAIAALCGGTAGGFAAVFLILIVREQVRFEGIPLADPDSDALVVLTRSFRGGRFGREEILSRLDGFELALGVPGHRPGADTEALLTVPEKEFLDYVEAKIARLEQLS
ncbi:MAG: hypothetical protein L3K08_03535 [Thermoplasmata archaeon]|nr:hypothetical protein [Thermoplasmata archaeon]